MLDEGQYKPLGRKISSEYKMDGMDIADNKVMKDLPYRGNGGKFKVSDYEYFDVGNKKHPFNLVFARS